MVIQWFLGVFTTLVGKKNIIDNIPLDTRQAWANSVDPRSDTAEWVPRTYILLQKKKYLPDTASDLKLCKS